MSRADFNHSAFDHQIADEDLAYIWTLNSHEVDFVNTHQFQYKLHVALQLCSLRKYGRFLESYEGVSTKVLNYLAAQFDQPASFKVEMPRRRVTYSKQCLGIIQLLGFRRSTVVDQGRLTSWILTKIEHEIRIDPLIEMAEYWLLSQKVVLPARKMLRRLINSVLNGIFQGWFESIYQTISEQSRERLDRLTLTTTAEPTSFFAELKEYPPAASIGAMNLYLDRFQKLKEFQDPNTNFDSMAPNFIKHVHELAKRYDAWEIKRFPPEKRYTILSIFVFESQKVLIDYLVLMHDQFMMKILREAKNFYEKQQRTYRKKNKKALEGVLSFLDTILNLENNKKFERKDLFSEISKSALEEDIKAVRFYKDLEANGFIEILSRKYRGLRRYFSKFVELPFEIEEGNESILESIELVRKLDSGGLKRLPATTPTAFIDYKLRKELHKSDGSIRRSLWEIGLAIAIKDKLRSGDVYFSQSKRHTSFWNLLYSDKQWQQEKILTCKNLQLHENGAAEIKKQSEAFEISIEDARKRFTKNDFATVVNGTLKLKKDDKLERPPAVDMLQTTISASLPRIRIEDLILEVDQEINFTRYFIPIQGSRQESSHSYKSLIAALVAMATNLGIIAMANSTDEISVDNLREVVRTCLREETIKAANAELVNQHAKLPLSAYYGSGSLSSSDGQRFKVRGNCLLATYYPRYFGYYEKGIGIYTHVSDQYSVFGTKVISCSPREALYVLDGLLENDTILGIKEHTTDTEGYTEHIFALCRLLGYKFMPRIKNLKDQTLYRIDKTQNYGEIDPLLKKVVDLELIKEQWDKMLRVVSSLKQRLTPAHIIIQRLASTSPADRLSRAFTNLGRMEKTQYILQYVTDPLVRRKAHVQLNKGEYRHKLPRWIFFANQGEFQTGNYEEIMNKASCLSLVSNIILYWNTKKIAQIIEQLKDQGEKISEETLTRISLLPFKHIIPNGTYFSRKLEREEQEGDHV